MEDLGTISKPQTQLFLKNPAFWGKAHFILFLTKPHQGSSRHTYAWQGCESPSSTTNVSHFPIRGKSRTTDPSRQLSVTERMCTMRRRILQSMVSPALGSSRTRLLFDLLPYSRHSLLGGKAAPLSLLDSKPHLLRGKGLAWKIWQEEAMSKPVP